MKKLEEIIINLPESQKLNETSNDTPELTVEFFVHTSEDDIHLIAKRGEDRGLLHSEYLSGDCCLTQPEGVENNKVYHCTNLRVANISYSKGHGEEVDYELECDWKEVKLEWLSEHCDD